METEQVMTIKIDDHKTGLDAGIVIDTLRENNSCGGVRILDDVDLEETKLLAKSMTLKFGFILDSSVGGAKAYIKIPKPCNETQKKAIIKKFAEKSAPIIKMRIYSPHTDMNCSDSDLNIIYESLELKRVFTGDSSYFTALGLVAALSACTQKFDLGKNPTLIICGFGNVGTYLAKELEHSNIKIIGVSNVNGAVYNENGLELRKLVELRNKFKDNFLPHYLKFDRKAIQLPRDSLLFKKCGILMPAARPNSINNSSMKKINARIVLPAANNPYAGNACKYLSKKGTLVFPDFVSNCGGVYGTSLTFRGMHENTIRKIILNDFSKLILNLIDKSKSESKELAVIAEEITMENISKHLDRNDKYKSSRIAFKLLAKKIIKFLPGFLKDGILSLNEKRRLSRLIY